MGTSKAFARMGWDAGVRTAAFPKFDRVVIEKRLAELELEIAEKDAQIRDLSRDLAASAARAIERWRRDRDPALCGGVADGVKSGPESGHGPAQRQKCTDEYCDFCREAR